MAMAQKLQDLALLKIPSNSPNQKVPRLYWNEAVPNRGKIHGIFLVFRVEQTKMVHRVSWYLFLFAVCIYDTIYTKWGPLDS